MTRDVAKKLIFM